MSDARLRERERRWREQDDPEAAAAYDAEHQRAGLGLSEPRRAAYKRLLELIHLQARTIHVTLAPLRDSPRATYIKPGTAPLVSLNGRYLVTGCHHDDYTYTYEGNHLRIVLARHLLEPLDGVPGPPVWRNPEMVSGARLTIELVGEHGILREEIVV